jgi:hypothetical protein
MMPAQLLSGAVAVSPYPEAQPFRLRDQLVTRHHFQIIVHGISA